MSDTDPIAADSPLGRALNGGAVPPLPTDFADRIVARTGDRPASLPRTRKTGGGVWRWRSARRFGIGLAVTGALASAAAATGLLGELPSPQRVWSAITGEPAEPDVTTQPRMPIEPSDPATEAVETDVSKTEIEGPIDTPEELEEAFRRADQRRGNRKANRQENIDRRIENAIERRRAQGLPAPTPEQEARLRQRIEQRRETSDARAQERIEARREEMRKRIEEGETLAPKDIAPSNRTLRSDPQRRQRLQELRDLPPAERRQRLRDLRQERLQQQPVQQDVDAKADAPETAASEENQ